jgi:hypothetical protein
LLDAKKCAAGAKLTSPAERPIHRITAWIGELFSLAGTRGIGRYTSGGSEIRPCLKNGSAASLEI